MCQLNATSKNQANVWNCISKIQKVKPQRKIHKLFTSELPTQNGYKGRLLFKICDQIKSVGTNLWAVFSAWVSSHKNLACVINSDWYPVRNEILSKTLNMRPAFKWLITVLLHSYRFCQKLTYTRPFLILKLVIERNFILPPRL